MPHICRIALLSLILLSSCAKWNHVDDQLFVGEWELKGRGFYEGMHVKIERKGSKLVGYVSQIPEGNIYARDYMKIGDKWVKSISRASNYAFRLTESRIAADLMSSYGLSTSEEYRVQFISPDRFGLTTGTADPKKSKIYYERISE